MADPKFDAAEYDAVFRKRIYGDMPYITAIDIEDFKSFAGKHEIPARRLTLIYGQNSSGKSTIIEALRVLKAIHADDKRALGWDYRQSYRASVHRHDAKRRIGLGIRFIPPLNICDEIINAKSSALAGLPNGAIEALWGQGLGLTLRSFPFKEEDGAIRLGEIEFRVRTENTADDWVSVKFIGGGGDYFSIFKPSPKRDLETVAAQWAMQILAGVVPEERRPLVEGLLALHDEQHAAQLDEYLTAEFGTTPVSDFLDLLTDGGKALRRAAKKFHIHWDGYVNPGAHKDGGEVRYRELTAWYLDPPNNIAGDFAGQLILALTELTASAAEFTLGRVQFVEAMRSRSPYIAKPSTLSDMTELELNFGAAAHILFQGMHYPWITQENLDTTPMNQWLQRLGFPYELVVFPNASTSSELKWLGEVLPEGGVIALRNLRNSHIALLDSVGYGISQVMPIIAQMTNGTVDMKSIPRLGVKCLQQPELHLHPKAQTELGDLLLHGVELGHQVIAETHSEHLLMRVQRRVREGVIAPDDVCVLYVDMDEKGRSTAQRLRLDETGAFIDPWPHGFFSERLDELLGDL